MNTSIVPIQRGANSIVPKPTRAQLVEVMTAQLIERREAENKIREQKRIPIRKKLDAEIARMKKKTLKYGDLKCYWQHVGAYLYIEGQNIPTPPRMIEINRELSKLADLPTQADYVKREVEDKLKTEMLKIILAQPGIKEGIGSALVKLGL